MGLEDVLRKLGAEKSIKAAFPLDGEFYNEVIGEEGGITESSFGMPLVNRALEEVLKRKIAVCLFCESTFETPTDHVMVLEDGCGNIIGHDVPAHMMDDFRDDPEILWLCEDFAVYPHKAESHDVLMVMLPQNVKSVGENEGVMDPVLLYPATTTDIMLRKHFGIPMNDPKIASAILAFNLV
ncbi:MAG: hypothetical protein LBU30_01660 [Candidatus Methanoplasma sp.]|jgi:hypothetical protein|nr:hypothetical protein [Candidatus Methanoplasma sp.]